MEEWQNYLDGLDSPDKRQAVIDALLTAEKYIPDAQRVMSYGVPALQSNGQPVIAAAAHKQHLGIYPFGGSIFKAIEDKLEGLEYFNGTIRFPYDNLPSEKLLKTIVKAKLESLKR